MKILVTGHMGFIGSKLCKKLVGHEVVGIDLKEGKDLLSCELPTGIDLIYHLAAQTSVEESWKDPINDAKNFLITIRLTLSYPATKIIYASSAAIIKPNSPYGFSKLISGEYLKTFQGNTTVLVFPNIFGHDGKGVVDIFKNTDHVTIYGDGQQCRDFVYIDDIVEGLLQAQSWPTKQYFMGSGESVKIIDLAKGKNIHFAPPRFEIVESFMSNTTPSWKPKIKVLEYLKEYNYINRK